MAGHNKWAQIRHKKGAADKKRSQLFARISRLITIAARKGTDPKTNTSLAQMIARAKSENMPSESILRAIKKSGDKDQSEAQEVHIDAIGPFGVAIRVRAITDNSNRTISEIKTILAEKKTKVVLPGSTAWMFESPISSTEEISNQIKDLIGALEDHPDIEDIKTNIK